ATGYLAMAGKARHALTVLLAVGGGTLLSSTLKIFFNRPRPDLVAHIVDVQSASFPSGHALISAVAYLALGALLAQAEKNLHLRLCIGGLAVALPGMLGGTGVCVGGQ